MTNQSINNQKGFIPIVVLILALVGLGAGAIFIQQKTQFFSQGSTPKQAEQPADLTQLPTDTPIPSGTVTPKNSKSTPTPTSTKSKTTGTPTPTSSSTTSSDNSCSYNLSGPSGAIKVDIKPRNGLVVGDQIVELHAKSGCKVLDGRYTDNQQIVARAGGNGYSSINSVTYSTVPEGSYSVRIQYKGQWTGYTNVDTVSGQSRTVEIFVDGETPTSTPTPTPKPKPICTVYVAPEGSGSAPYQASVCVGNHSNPYQNIQEEFADYDGDGNWDYQGPSYGCHSYTFQNPGTYTPKAKIVGIAGETSDICQTTATIN